MDAGPYSIQTRVDPSGPGMMLYLRDKSGEMLMKIAVSRRNPELVAGTVDKMILMSTKSKHATLVPYRPDEPLDVSIVEALRKKLGSS
jgi:hypothetical protein